MKTRPTVAFDLITSIVQEELRSTERLLVEGMRSVAERIPEVGEHAWTSGGKRMRPLLVLLSSRLCGYVGPRASQIGAAVEYFHGASLLHDDVVDGARERRGRPSVNARFGERSAVLVGDFMYARACQMLVEDGNLEILALYADALRLMTEGEIMQLSQSFDPEVGESVYTDIIGRKTASLLAAAAESGAILGAVTRAERRAVYEYGWELGLAFQLVDDALDYAGACEELGKRPLADLSEGKVTLPLLVTLKRCSVAERESINAVLKTLGRDPGEDLEATACVAESVARHRGVAITLDRAAQRAAVARAKIAPFAPSPAKEALLQLTEFVIQRRH